MYNSYITTLLLDLQGGLEDCKNFIRTLEDFLHDYPFIEGMNKNFPPSTIDNAIKRAESLESTINELMKAIKENMSDNG